MDGIRDTSNPVEETNIVTNVHDRTADREAIIDSQEVTEQEVREAQLLLDRLDISNESERISSDEVRYPLEEIGHLPENEEKWTPEHAFVALQDDGGKVSLAVFNDHPMISDLIQKPWKIAHHLNRWESIHKIAQFHRLLLVTRMTEIQASAQTLPGSHDRYQNTGDLAQSQAGHEKSEWNISPGTPEKLDPNKFYGNKFKKQALFKIHPPKTFPYEIRMTSNSTKQGLLYTITKPERIEYWQRILSHYGSSSSLEKVADYIKGKQVIQLSNDQFVETYNIQIEAFNSVEEIMTDDNYLGEGQNYEGKPQLYWEIKDMHRNFPIMVMGMSKESNPFAEIITIFFIDQFEYNRRKRNGWITKH
ncbi:hypothetical protein FO519_008591 [Halicephalobus sp. NKZ332]|nr:hypothetical protein FO519_008591 [Halicephalobus sp. NKZ332]